MSDYPASLGDLADVEARLDERLAKLQRRQGEDAGVTDEKFAHLREELAKQHAWCVQADGALKELDTRVRELERLWAVALENPDLVRELAAQALKGRSPG